MRKRKLEEEFSALADRLRAAQLTVDHLAALKSLQLLYTNSYDKPSCTNLCAFLIGTITLLFVIPCLTLLLSPQLITDTLDIVGMQGVFSEHCLLALDSLLIMLFRPPVSCDICHNLSQVDRVSQLSREIFEEHYAYSGQPVIVTDAMVNWSAVHTFNFEFFRGIYSYDSPTLASSEDCQFFPYESGFRNLSEVFLMTNERANLRNGSKPWYIGWSNCDSAAANVLRTHYSRPYFLPDEAESSKTDWIFMGSPGFGAHLHIDSVGNPSWQAQVLGTKRWTLVPPPECYFECAETLEAVVSPGEIIVLDTNQWFHSTIIIGSNISIAIGSEYD